MREALAERLLAQVMQWTPEDVARERPALQAMASFKYDEYQQYGPGMRFIESLALWLNQFLIKDERKCAYSFVKQRLVFLSNAEMVHFVSVAYPDHIRPILIQRTATTLNNSMWMISKLINDKVYRSLRRQCLFLGLSDGARIDVFRRFNSELSHEQIWLAYEMTPEKAESIKEKLNKDLNMIAGKNIEQNETYFKMIFLLDDFSGSGLSYLRKSSEDGSFAGKIYKFYKQLIGPDTGLSKLVNLNDLYVGVTLYVATDKTRLHLERNLTDLFDGTNIKWGIQIIQNLADDVSLQRTEDKDFLRLVDKYYDSNAEDEHTEKGGKDIKLGFNDCGLPLVLGHNTPNNSIFLLWAYPNLNYRGLFPRISRHRSEA